MTLALQVVNPGSIPGIPLGPLSPPGVIPELLEQGVTSKHLRCGPKTTTNKRSFQELFKKPIRVTQGGSGVFYCENKSWRKKWSYLALLPYWQKHYEAFWNPGIPEKLIWRKQNKKTGTRDSKAQRDSTEGKTFDICFA